MAYSPTIIPLHVIRKALVRSYNCGEPPFHTFRTPAEPCCNESHFVLEYVNARAPGNIHHPVESILAPISIGQSLAKSGQRHCLWLDRDKPIDVAQGRTQFACYKKSIGASVMMGQDQTGLGRGDGVQTRRWLGGLIVAIVALILVASSGTAWACAGLVPEQRVDVGFVSGEKMSPGKTFKLTLAAGAHGVEIGAVHAGNDFGAMPGGCCGGSGPGCANSHCAACALAFLDAVPTVICHIFTSAALALTAPASHSTVPSPDLRPPIS